MAAPDPKSLTREQLAAFLPNQESIRRFERLFEQAGTLTPAQIAILYQRIQEVLIDAGIAGARAGEAIDSLLRIERDVDASPMSAESSAVAVADSVRRIAQALEVIASRPQAETPRTIGIDYVDFDLLQKHAYKVGRVSWGQDDTLNIDHSNGVTQQVGNELYAYIPLNSGPNLLNGQVIGFNPGPNTHIPFIANGTYDTFQVIGVATQDIANGGSGRVTVWGRVRNIDTTGTPFGEVWSAGQLLYVSTSVAGGFTNVKPTAPNQSIPIAQVRVVSASAGEVFVRPTIEQELYYGVFSKTSDQAPAAANTAYSITWDNTEIANGVSIGAPSSRIVAEHAGLYKFIVSFQLTSGSASVKNVWLWFRKNGVDIPNSSMITSLDSATAIRTPSRAFNFSLQAGDYVELMFASDSTAMTVDNIPATAFAPAAPSALLTVNQEQQ